MVVANLTSEPRRIVLPGASQGHILDLTQVASAARDPHWLHSPGETFAALDLGAYACTLLAAGAAQASVE